MERERGYGAGARALHWITVALLLVIIPLGLVMGSLPRGLLQDTCFIAHESLGITVLGLTLLRFFWRLMHPPPRATGLTPLERHASVIVHAALYVILLAAPLTGYLYISFRGITLHFFGLVAVPAAVAPAKPLAHLAWTVHSALPWAIYALVAIHFGAALYHYFVRRDGVMARMVPSLNRR
ncbi:MAG TPA: cytochrome b [Stellaceae bacterium]|jgi:cytochrome b561|nr:cytochrome b [Stellaceae bacterium]